MAGLPVITVEGRLGADPDLRFLPSGVAVCNFSIVSQDRRKSDAGDWEDAGDPLWIRVAAFRTLGENAAESLAKGDLVIVVGKLSNRKWEDKEGGTRYSLEMNAYNIGASVQFRTIKHSAGHRNGGQGGSQTRAAVLQGGDDPWASQEPPDSDEPPF